MGGTLVVLIKEIGTDALFALRLLASYMDKNMGTSYLPRVRKFHDHCRDNDLAVAVAQTDVKGDRGKGPADQAHPDYYVRVAAQDEEGITLRGAKVHTSVSTNAHEIIVLPTRNMRAGDEAYAVACAVPANAPGLTMLASGYGGRKGTEFENPISSKHKMMETLTVFDDVKVPWERVFLNGEVEMAGPLAKTFVEFHRFTAVSYKLPLVDLFVGASHLMAEYNGILRAGHVRDKLAKLISYAQICRGMTARGREGVQGHGRRRRAECRDHQHREAPLRHRLPPGARLGAGHRGGAARHRPERGGPGRPEARRAHRQIPGRIARRARPWTGSSS